MKFRMDGQKPATTQIHPIEEGKKKKKEDDKMA